jgi:hypothetical protein
VVVAVVAKQVELLEVQHQQVVELVDKAVDQEQIQEVREQQALLTQVVEVELVVKVLVHLQEQVEMVGLE